MSEHGPGIGSKEIVPDLSSIKSLESNQVLQYIYSKGSLLDSRHEQRLNENNFGFDIPNRTTDYQASKVPINSERYSFPDVSERKSPAVQGLFYIIDGHRINSSVELPPKSLLSGLDTRTERGSQSLDQSETHRLLSIRNTSHLNLYKYIHDKDITGNISTQKTISLLPKSTNLTEMLGPVSRMELLSQIIVDERFKNNATVYPHAIRDLAKLNAVTPNTDGTDGANVIEKLPNKAFSKAYSENKSNETKSLMFDIPATKIEANIDDEIEKEIQEIFGNSNQNMWTKKTGR